MIKRRHITGGPSVINQERSCRMLNWKIDKMTHRGRLIWKKSKVERRSELNARPVEHPEFDLVARALENDKANRC